MEKNKSFRKMKRKVTLILGFTIQFLFLSLLYQNCTNSIVAEKFELPSTAPIPQDGGDGTDNGSGGNSGGNNGGNTGGNNGGNNGGNTGGNNNFPPIDPGVGPFPIMFVTVVPHVSFQGTLNTFGNHSTSIVNLIPGGDLHIAYPNGVVRNLTQEAGWGVASGQIQGGEKAIAVRQPTIHWSGKKALFAMAIGGPTARYQNPIRHWQIYEVSGIGLGEAVQIVKVPGQPPNYNNMSPVYGSNDEIFFTSDAPLFGRTNLYPQLDEYESATTNTGIFKLIPATGELTQIQHSPSGSFDLFVDSAGRLIFSRWDHLKRDQQADADRTGNGYYRSYDVVSEVDDNRRIYPQMDALGRFVADSRGVLYDVFPEARSPANIDRSRREHETLHDFNHFAPWQINQDGSEEEMVNHVGNDELFRYYKRPVFNNDSNLTDRLTDFSRNRMIFPADAGFFQFKEDFKNPGTFLSVYAKEFGRQSSGRVIEIKMGVGVNPEDMEITDLTNDTLDDDPEGSQPRRPSMTGHYRNPVRLDDGTILVSHTPEYRKDVDEGSGTVHNPRYKFRIKRMIRNPNGSDWIAGPTLVPGEGFVKNIRWWRDEATAHSYNGPLSEVDIVEVRPRPRPPSTRMHIADIEKQVMSEEQVDETQFRNWLKQRNLAVIVTRNITIRDRADITQPFNLRIPNGVSNIVSTGKVYDITALQIFQADLTRAYENQNGRRVYARPINNNHSHNNIQTYYQGRADGKVQIAADGSTAAIVPAGRALTWQTVSADDSPVVRERYWVTFAAGEVRTCASCHGVNSISHNGLQEPTNKPQAFRQLLRTWKTNWWNQ